MRQNRIGENFGFRFFFLFKTLRQIWASGGEKYLCNRLSVRSRFRISWFGFEIAISCEHVLIFGVYVDSPNHFMRVEAALLSELSSNRSLNGCPQKLNFENNGVRWWSSLKPVADPIKDDNYPWRRKINELLNMNNSNFILTHDFEEKEEILKPTFSPIWFSLTWNKFMCKPLFQLMVL